MRIDRGHGARPSVSGGPFHAGALSATSAKGAVLRLSGAARVEYSALAFCVGLVPWIRGPVSIASTGDMAIADYITPTRVSIVPPEARARRNIDPRFRTCAEPFAPGMSGRACGADVGWSAAEHVLE